MSAAYVALSIGSREYAIAKMVNLADGGWSLIPLIKPDPFPGWLLTEFATDYSRAGRVAMPRGDLLAEYASDYPVKLSIHSAGFVQFSRVGDLGVLSGRDAVTGRPRGLGHLTRPITDPPRSGPMFTMTAWGITEYPPLRPCRPAVVIGEDELYDAQPDSPDIGNAYAFDFWPLPRWALAYASISTGLRFLEMPGHAFYAGQPFRFTVLDTGNRLVILGLVVTRFRSHSRSPAGASLGGPSDRRGERALMGILPAPYSDGVPSADFEKASPQLAEPRAILPITWWLSEVNLARPWGRRSAVSGKPPGDEK